MKKLTGRVTSVSLAFVMAASVFQTLPQTAQPVMADETEDTTAQLTSKVSDLVQVKIGDTLNTLDLYNNGVYEAKVALPAGESTATLLINGEETSLSDTVTLDAAGDVYFRLQNGELKDSVNETIVHTAAWVGTIGDFSYLKDASDPESAYTIGSWTPADENAELDYIGGGIYERTFYMNAVETDTDIEYKVAFDDGWDYSIGKDGNNAEITIPAGTTSVTIFCDEINGKLYDSVSSEPINITQNTGTVTKPAFCTTVSLIGSARDNDAWEASVKGYEFTQISDTLYLYQKVFNKGAYEYKTIFDYTNWYEKKDGNTLLNISEDNTNVVFLYDASTEGLYDTVNNPSDVAQYLGMQAAPAKAEIISKGNGDVEFITVADDAENVSLVYGIRSEVEADEKALTKVSCKKTGNGGYSSGAISFGDAKAEIVYYYEVDGEKVLDGAAEKVTVGAYDYSVYEKPEYAGRTVSIPGTLPSDDGNWNAASNVMTYKGNGMYEYTFKDVPAGNYEYKIALDKAWTENYGADGIQGGSNIALTVPDTQDVIVYYNDYTHLTATSVDYIIADVSLSGSGIEDGTKLSDSGLTGIYTASVDLGEGTYSDIKLTYNEKEFEFSEFKLEAAKRVTFYFDPVSEIYYCNASDQAIETENVKYDSKDIEFKNPFGAVATGEDVTFKIQTGEDITSVKLVIKGMEKNNLEMKKDGEAVDGIQKWTVTTKFSQIGANTYYFAISNGFSVSIYADDDGNYGTGTVTDLTNIKPYDLIVYKDGYETPDWMKNAVIYQIFPERFYDADESNDKAQISARGTENYEYVNDWYTLPENPEQEERITKEEYEAAGAFYGDGNWSNEIYGGDLKGITERIDYLKALGVNVIYLNPVFSSISSHRYDTSDYAKIDPILGTLGDFEELVNIAKENNMHVVLDGVFNHVSDDSIYFDRYYKYLEAGTDKVGAYPYWAYVYDTMSEKDVSIDEAQTIAKKYFEDKYGITDFSYTEWFNVTQDTLKDDDKNEVKDSIGQRAGKAVYGYEGWWGYDSMPVIKSTNGSEYQTGNWGEEIIGNDDKTSVTQYWLEKGSNGWRLDVANEVSDETWQNFRESVKALNDDNVIIGEIWTDASKYLLGDMYDSVMNYVFRDAVIGFAKGGSAQDAMNTLERIRERYPKEAFYAMMNLVSSHDTSRVLSFLDGIGDDREDKTINGAFPRYETTSDLAKQRQYLVAFMQFTYAGAPTIYYGDEIGMVGADDPDDRRAFEWGKGNKELVTWYATLAQIRNSYAALRTGTVEPFETGCDNIMSYVRGDDTDRMIVLSNNSQNEQEITIDTANLGVSASELTDLISGSRYTVSDGKVTVTVPALKGVILTDDVKTISVNTDDLAPAYDPSYIIEVRKDIVADDEKKDDTSKTEDEKKDDTSKTEDVKKDDTSKAEDVKKGDTSKAEDVKKDDTSKAEDIKKDDTSKAEDVKKDDTSKTEDVKKDDTSKTDDTTASDTTKTVTTADTADSTEKTVTTAAKETVDWDKEADAIKNADPKAVLSVKMDESGILPTNILEALKGTDKKLVLDMGNGIKWIVNGADISKIPSKDIDMSVTVGGNAVPENVIKNSNLGKDVKKTLQVSLGHDGEFGFKPVLSLEIGKEYAGQYANLYYYNPDTKKLEGQVSVLVKNDGTAQFTFEHASDYVISVTDEAAITNTKKSPNGGDDQNMALYIALMGFAAAMIGVSVYRKKRS